MLSPISEPENPANLAIQLFGLAKHLYDVASDVVIVWPTDLQKIVPTLSAQRAIEISYYLSLAMTEAEVNTPMRKAAFLSQMAHEGIKALGEGDLVGKKSFPEYDSKGGNTKVGDGTLYKGRGFIQLTGKTNYTNAGEALGLDLVKHPELVENDLAVAAKVTAWYWKACHANKFADSGDFDGVTIAVVGPDALNRDTTDMPGRRESYAKAKLIFGISR